MFQRILRKILLIFLAAILISGTMILIMPGSLYAPPSGPPHTVTYDGKGNTGGTVPVDGSTYVAGDTVTVLGNTGSPVKTGSTFLGWKIKKMVKDIPTLHSNCSRNFLSFLRI